MQRVFDKWGRLAGWCCNNCGAVFESAVDCKAHEDQCKAKTWEDYKRPKIRVGDHGPFGK